MNKSIRNKRLRAKGLSQKGAHVPSGGPDKRLVITIDSKQITKSVKAGAHYVTKTWSKAWVATIFFASSILVASEQAKKPTIESQTLPAIEVPKSPVIPSASSKEPTGALMPPRSGAPIPATREEAERAFGELGVPLPDVAVIKTRESAEKQEKEEASLKTVRTDGGAPATVNLPTKVVDFAPSKIDEVKEAKKAEEKPQANENQNKIAITKSGVNRRAYEAAPERPSVRHIEMAPSNSKYGGDDPRIMISPLFSLVIQMPTDIQAAKSSNDLLSVEIMRDVESKFLTLKLKNVEKPIPMSLHIIDISGRLYTMTIIATPADISKVSEYPKTIIVNNKKFTEPDLEDAKTTLAAMDISDLTTIVNAGRTYSPDFYKIELLNARYVNHRGYALYAFRVRTKDLSPIDTSKLKFTFWANDNLLDGGSPTVLKKKVVWEVHKVLSEAETKASRKPTLRVFAKIRGSILDFEEWQSAFVTVAGPNYYSKHAFQPIIRSFRAPIESPMSEVDGEETSSEVRQENPDLGGSRADTSFESSFQELER